MVAGRRDCTISRHVGGKAVIPTPRTTVSIVIKALNEERHIATAIEGALAALDGMQW